MKLLNNLFKNKTTPALTSRIKATQISLKHSKPTDSTVKPGTLNWLKRFVSKFHEIMYTHTETYGGPNTMSNLYIFGFASMFFLINQIFSGVLLCAHYIPETDLAWTSVHVEIERNVHNGWWLRSLHIIGANFYFICIYIHIYRGLLYKSWIKTKVWLSGLVILLLSMGTAFFGYVLPWSQMGFWAATVITNFATSIPFFGNTIAKWLWGSYTVSHKTLNRFLSIHYTLPFIVLACVGLHLLMLHQEASKPKNCTLKNQVKSPFSYRFVAKDIFIFWVILLLFVYVIHFAPRMFNHPEEWQPCDPNKTPKHIIPEWYFLPFYAILRSVENKILGLILMFLAIIGLALFPLLQYVIPKKISEDLNLAYSYILGIYVWSLIYLGYLGAQPATYPYTVLGFGATITHFGCYILFAIAVYLDHNDTFRKGVANITAYLNTYALGRVIVAVFL